jgi:uncharacterized protein YciI
MRHYFVYKLIAPRSSFAHDMNESEAAIMRQHSGYWQSLLDLGDVLIFGQVLDPAGAWGLAVVGAETAEDVHLLGIADPAVQSGLMRFEVYPIPRAVVATRGADAHQTD